MYDSLNIGYQKYQVLIPGAYTYCLTWKKKKKKGLSDAIKLSILR